MEIGFLIVNENETVVMRLGGQEAERNLGKDHPACPPTVAVRVARDATPPKPDACTCHQL